MTKTPDDCLCGDPPYVKGALCPPCHEQYVAELIAKAERGEMHPMNVLAMAFVALPRAEEPDDEDNDLDEIEREDASEVREVGRKMMEVHRDTFQRLADTPTPGDDHE
jgi:hypothetical protein